MDEWHEITKSATAAFLNATAIIAKEFECEEVKIRAYTRNAPEGYRVAHKDVQQRFVAHKDVQQRFVAVGMLPGGEYKEVVCFMRVNFSGSTRPWELRVGDKAVRIANLSDEKIREGCERVKLGKR